jgi:Mn-dependent DtxR family transcriptional regulator
MRNLRADGYILVNEDGYITLTDSGREIAEMIYERHRLLKNLLMSIGVGEAIAAEDACRIEHVISKESFEALKQHVWDEHQIDADTQM